MITKILRRLGILNKTLSKTHVSYWILKILEKKSSQLVQIGSNDGKTGDPLHQLLLQNKNWSCLFVEPVPYLYERLVQNYPKESRFSFENAAISHVSDLTFYSVDPKAKKHLPDLPYWYDQLGSFERDHIANQLDGVLKPFIITTEVRCISLDSLFKNHGITKVDLLHIDTEGYDWKILRELDLSKYNPKVILFEHHHLADAEIAEAVKFLTPHYSLYIAGIDILCIHKLSEVSITAQIASHLTHFESANHLLKIKRDHDEGVDKTTVIEE